MRYYTEQLWLDLGQNWGEILSDCSMDTTGLWCRIAESNTAAQLDAVIITDLLEHELETLE